MTHRRIEIPEGGTLADALVAANDELLAAVAAAQLDDPPIARVWELPRGDYEVEIGLALGAAEANLTVSGAVDPSDPEGLGGTGGLAGTIATALSFGDFEFSLTGRALELSKLEITSSVPSIAVALTGVDVVATDLSITGTTDQVPTALRITGSGQARAERIQIERVRGLPARGLAVDAPRVVLRRVTVSDVRQVGHTSDESAEPTVEQALDAVRGAVGITVDASERADIEDVRVEVVRGTPAVGIRLETETGVLTGAVVGDVTAIVPPRLGSATGLWAIAPTGSLAIGHFRVDGIRGVAARGAAARSPDLRFADVTIRNVIQISESFSMLGLPTTIERLDGVRGAVGISAEATERLDAVRIELESVRGRRSTGARLIAPGDVSIVDLRAHDIRGPSDHGIGVLAVAGSQLRVRGFTLTRVDGRKAVGLLGVCGDGVEVVAGRIEDVSGRGPFSNAAAGMRLLAATSETSVVVRDVQIEAVGLAQSAPGGVPRPQWATWRAEALQSAFAAVEVELPLPPTVDDVVGLHVGASVEVSDPLLDQREPGPIRVEDTIVRRISGTALQVEGGMRTTQVRRMESWMSARAGFIESEQVLLAELTWHLHGAGVVLGPGDFAIYNCLFTAIATAPVLSRLDGAELAAVRASLSTTDEPPLELISALPYREPGPNTVPPAILIGFLPPDDGPIDLRLVDDAAVLDAAVPIPGDGDAEAPFVGAHPPEVPVACSARDPLPRRWAAATAAPVDDPVANYRARDFEALLALMLDRARTTMSAWTDRGPADFTTMLFELLAERLDHLAYAQERAVQEGFLERATLRRSVEDHARPLDYVADLGLSATAMVRVQLAPESELVELASVLDGLQAAAMVPVPAGADALESIRRDGFVLPADTLLANDVETADALVVFATGESLTYARNLDAMPLADECAAGAISARLDVRVDDVAPLEIGRWLVLSHPDRPRHVVRVTAVEPAVDSVLVRWDPRRPAPVDYPSDETFALGNVVPAHHGLPLRAYAEGEADDPLFGRYREGLTVDVEGMREVAVPFDPVSVIAAGYPRPDEVRQGTPQIRVDVEGDEWARVDQLALAGPGDEVYVLRPSAEVNGGAVVRFGDGISGAALPGRLTPLTFALSVGVGRVGNVGTGALTRLVRWGTAGLGEVDLQTTLSAQPGSDWDDFIRRLVLFANPLPAVGGRDPEPLARIAYRAPFTVRDALSAVTPADYERLLLALPEVAGARARVFDRGIRTEIRMTVLLRDEDTLDEAERLRRWALVRGRLEQIRLVGFDVSSVPPVWVPLDLDLVVDARDHAGATAVHDAVVEALAGNGGLFDPDQTGLGGDIHLSHLYRAVLAVPGVAGVRFNRFRRLEPGATDQFDEGVIAIGDEEVGTLRGPNRASADGLLTVTVCGGLR